MSSEGLISVEEARGLAEELARFEVRVLKNYELPNALLNPDELEAEGCWIFFMRDELVKDIKAAYIELLKKHDGMMGLFGCYAISKTGSICRYVYDFRNNGQKMRDYLEIFSLYALGKEKESRAALADFDRKYPM
jgi:hypothetical protein